MFLGASIIFMSTQSGVSFTLSASCFRLVISSTNLQSHLLHTLSGCISGYLHSIRLSVFFVPVTPSLCPSLLYLIDLIP